jgi:hypothetical protein
LHGGLGARILVFLSLLLDFLNLRDLAPLSPEIIAAINSSIISPAHSYGSWADPIVMSDDFDAPLEDLNEYM